MKTRMAWVLTAVLAAVAAGAEEPAQALARGKLEADLGHHAVAAEAFASVAPAPQATVPQRWEALVRLGVARRDAGDAKGSADAFEEAFRIYGKNPEALRFLLQAVGSALPGQERWDEVFSQVTLHVDRRVPDRPVVRVTWPGLPFGLCPCSGTPVDLDFQDTYLFDVLRGFADTSRLNVVVHPGREVPEGVMGRVFFKLDEVPWDQAFDLLVRLNGLTWTRTGDVIRVEPPRRAPSR